MKLSIIIPAYNEEANIATCLSDLRLVIRDKYAIPHEIICVNDNSSDRTEAVLRNAADENPDFHIVTRRPPRGFGRAVRAGIEKASGDVVVIYMADLSDDPEDVAAYYRKIQEGYDCVFGSRFIRGSVVREYPVLKLIINRIVNRTIQVMFCTRFEGERVPIRTSRCWSGYRR